MNREGVKLKNIRRINWGQFLASLVPVIISIYLPFFLKEQGFSILEIGAIFTIGMAFGGFVFSIVFSRVLRKIKLKVGLIFSGIFMFLQGAILYIFPTSFGATIAKFANTLEQSSYEVVHDVAMQHNVPKGGHRNIGSLALIYGSAGLLVGIVLGYLIITWFGFRTTFLVFTLLSLPLFYLYSGIKDDTRPKVKLDKRLPKIPGKLKVVLFAELLYWFSMAASFALVITFLVTDRFGSSMFWIGVMFAGLYLSIVITTLITKKFLDKKNLMRTSIIGMFLLCLSAIVIIISSNVYFVLVGMILEGIGAGIWVPSKIAVYWKLTEGEMREKVAGYLFGWRQITGTVGPLFGGILVTYLGIVAPFFFKGIITLLIIGIYFYIMRKS